MTIDDLRRFAVTRSFFRPATLKNALERFGFVQADPIRSPARAQDLILRHRVKGYRAGDLERRYHTLDIEEDTFINYGFVTRSVHELMHPRGGMTPLSKAENKRAQSLLEFVRGRGEVHPREVDRQFLHGSVTNYWGGSSRSTTRLLDDMRYRGLIRVARREDGVRIFAPNKKADQGADGVEADRQRRIDRLVDVAVEIYAPLPAGSLSTVVSRLRYAAPQWHGDLRAALRRAKARLSHARVGTVDWYWPAGEEIAHRHRSDAVRLLTPFDPVVWDRRRFELFWAWTYRFEAYTPIAKRRLGYYALPLLWGDAVIGWANVSVVGGELNCSCGYVKRKPSSLVYRRELAAELDRLREFLDLRT